MKRLLLIIATVTALGFSLALPVAASADYSVLNENGTGACQNAGSAAACNADTSSNPLVGPKGVIHNVTILIARVAGVVAIIIVIYSGMQMVIGGSDPSKIQTARQTLIYALAGIVVIVIGQTIILFVMDRFS